MSEELPLYSVERLTQTVSLCAGILPSKHIGTSDHMFHGQKVELTFPDGTVINFQMATFNVLAQIWVWYQSGKRADNLPLPNWYSLEGEKGLEKTPSSDEKNAVARQTETANIVSRFFWRESERTIICLQECSRDLLEVILESLPSSISCLSLLGEEPGTVIISNMNLSGSPFEISKTTNIARITEKEKTFVVVCAHLSFQTEKNKATFEQIRQKHYNEPIFIAGDYNIPCMPISEQAKNEGSTETLAEFINFYVCAKLGWKYAIAEHWRGYTNFNCRKNCADPTRNADHFDNILFLYKGEYSIKFTPVYHDDLRKWWHG